MKKKNSKTSFFSLPEILLDIIVSIFRKISKPGSQGDTDENYGYKSKPDVVHMIDEITPKSSRFTMDDDSAVRETERRVGADPKEFNNEGCE